MRTPRVGPVGAPAPDDLPPPPDLTRLDTTLTRLKPTAIRDQLDTLLAEAARRELTLVETVAFLCEREIGRKDERRIEMALGLARFPMVRDLEGDELHGPAGGRVRAAVASGPNLMRPAPSAAAPDSAAGGRAGSQTRSRVSGSGKHIRHRRAARGFPAPTSLPQYQGRTVSGRERGDGWTIHALLGDGARIATAPFSQSPTALPPRGSASDAADGGRKSMTERPYSSAKRQRSIGSIRRSPVSHFDTKEIGRSNSTATSLSVRPTSRRASRSATSIARYSGAKMAERRGPPGGESARERGRVGLACEAAARLLSAEGAACGGLEDRGTRIGCVPEMDYPCWVIVIHRGKHHPVRG